MLLVGYDGSEGGKDALELARILHSMDAPGVLVVTILLFGPLPVRHTLTEEEQSVVEPIFEEARLRIGVERIQTRAIAGGSPARALVECAESEGAETLVLGSPHRGAIGRAVLGSVAKGVLYGAPCEVVIAPRGYASRIHVPYRTIAVAYDGSAEAKAALRRAEALALSGNAKLDICTVAPPPITPPASWGITLPAPAEPDAVLREAIESVEDGIAVRGRRFDGAPARTLARACEDDVDLLVTGSRGHGPLARVFLGSVSSRLVQDAPCPVLVVPRQP